MAKGMHRGTGRRGVPDAHSPRKAVKRTASPGLAVLVEMRTGSGTTRKTIRIGSMSDGPLAIRRKVGFCIPSVMRCTDSFYGRIDRDIAEWRFLEDLRLGVPYAVRRWKACKEYERMRRKLVRGVAARKGVA